MDWCAEYQKKMVSIEEAAAVISSGDRICSVTGCGVPVDLLVAVGKRKEALRDVEIYSQLLFYPFDWLRGDYAGHIHYNSSFLGAIERKFVKEGNIGVASYQFSQTDWLLENRIRPTVFVAEVSLPDENGNMSLGAMGSLYGKRAAELAKTVILQVNRNVPYVCGGEEAQIHLRDVDYLCESQRDIQELHQAAVSADDEKIASYIMPYIHDGATIQLGLGGVSNAVGFSLKDHQHLGIHSEMFTDSLATLMQQGVIDNSRKTIDRGKATISFALGAKALYDYIHNNPLLEARSITYVANPWVIGQHDHFVSINSCLACDLTGQVGAESLGHNQFSATGGQLDFVRGAGISKGGKSFLCLHSVAQSRTGEKISKISAALPPGTAITTPRTDVDCIVTEYGIAELKGKDFAQRARAMIEISHPDFREALYNEAAKTGMIIK